jgi:hypothetical protein
MRTRVSIDERGIHNPMCAFQKETTSPMPVYRILRKNTAYSATYIHILLYQAFMYLSIHHGQKCRTTYAKVLLEGLERRLRSLGHMSKPDSSNKAMIDRLYSQKSISDQAITTDR